MADIKIQGPDGSSFSFPVGTPSDVIEGAMRSHYATYKPAAAPAKHADARDSFLGKVDSAVRGAADTLTFSLADELAAAGDAALNPLFGTGKSGASFSERYAANKAAENAIDAADAENRAGYRIAGQVAGGLTGGVGLARNGLSATSNAINAGKAMPAVIAASAKEGAMLGGLAGIGAGEGLEGRAQGGAQGLATGAIVGALAPPVISGVSKVAGALSAPLMARLRPDEYASSAVGEGLRRAGMTADDVAAALSAARADGQDVFTAADAMGNAGQRMLSTVARNPNDQRQAVVEALLSRQMDQGRRVAGALQDASGTILTARQFEDMAVKQRAADAARNYAPVKVDTTAIDVSPAVAAANRSISPAADNIARAQGAVPTDLAARAGIEAGEASIRDPIRQALKEARSYLASDSLTVTNVEKAFRAKTNIDQMIAGATEKGQGALVSELMPVQKALDDALANTSKQYAAARDAYSAASRPIDAMATGKTMASPRARSQDSISAFGALDTPSQNAARIGYFDPMISRAESAAGSMTDSARPFLSNSMRQELPVFAAPGQGERLTARLGREAQMSETAKAALGGSKTADNLADAAEMARFDPGIMTSLMRGRPIEAIMAAVAKGQNEAKGLPPRVIERIAKVLMETDPAEAQRVLSLAGDKTARSDGIRAVASAIMNNLGAGSAGRLAAP